MDWRLMHWIFSKGLSLLILQFPYHLIYDIQIAIQIKSGVRIMEPLASVTFIKYIESLFGRDVQTLGKKDDNASYFSPENGVS